VTSQAQCVKCYQPLVAGALFCPKCGTSTEDTTAPAPASVSAEVECPSCDRHNPVARSFCSSCGTQLHRAATGSAWQPEPDAPPTGPAPNAEPEPWAAGPQYGRPLNVDATCPQCGSFRNRDESVCENCGLPFGQGSNYRGVPPIVAARGNPAGFWIRFVAHILDGIILFAIGAIIWPVLFGEAFWVTETIEGTDGSTFAYGTTQSWHLLMQVLYSTFFLAIWGSTPGKALFNIRIYDASGRRGLGFPRAAVRSAAEILSVLTLMIGYTMAAFRSDKRSLHDLIAGTYPTIRNRRR
jgi:uncharacterized RDD family membrane protein YckC